MKLVKAIRPKTQGERAKEAELLMRSLPVAKPGLCKPQSALLVETKSELNRAYRTASNIGIKVEIRKANGAGWYVWRVK